MGYLTDKYETIARFCPALFLFLPIGLLCWLWFPSIRNIGDTIIGIILACGTAALIAKMVGDNGRNKQKMLIKKWGSFPTTKFLRYSDSTIDKITKQRYRLYLKEKLPNVNMPSEEEEKLDPIKADEIYESAINWLKEKARDKEKYYLVFNDNIYYGFSRNLWALKPLGLTISITGLVINGIAMYLMYDYKLKIIPVECYTITILLILSVLTWVFVITSDFVYKAGEKYAKSLLAVCDNNY